MQEAVNLALLCVVSSSFASSTAACALGLQNSCAWWRGVRECVCKPMSRQQLQNIVRLAARSASTMHAYMHSYVCTAVRVLVAVCRTHLKEVEALLASKAHLHHVPPVL